MSTFLMKHHWKILNLLCCFAFIWQLYGIMDDWIHPSRKTTDIMENKLEDLEFPIVFKVCLKPGFNITALKEEGYSSIPGYFTGQSRYNSSIYGWAGHINNSQSKSTVEDVYKKVEYFPNIENALITIKLWAMSNEFYTIPLKSLKVWRPNLPFNCFTLDLTGNEEV